MVKSRWFNYLVVRCDNKVLLGRRTAKDIWQNLYEYPLIETDRPVDFSDLQSIDVFRRLFDPVEEIVLHRVVPMPKHVLSHRVIHAVFYELGVAGFSSAMLDNYLVVSDKDLDRYAVSRLIDLYRSR